MKKGFTTRENIIAHSARLFNILGYHGCAVSDIMEATSLQKGGMYNHFKNKDEIALAAFDYAFNETLQRFKIALEKCINSTEKLNTIINVFANFHADPVLDGGCPVFNTAVDSNGSHPELKERAKVAINTLKKYIEIKIDEGKDSGEFHANTDSEYYSTLMILTMEGALIMARLNDDSKPVHIAVKNLKRLIKTELKR